MAQEAQKERQKMKKVILQNLQTGKARVFKCPNAKQARNLFSKLLNEKSDGDFRFGDAENLTIFCVTEAALDSLADSFEAQGVF